VDPPSKILTKLVNKNAMKPEKGLPYPPNFHNPYILNPKNLIDPPPELSNPVHL
jgi:hypothetical protein